jgi:DNA-binding NarL/FixJ family response regulator
MIFEGVIYIVGRRRLQNELIGACLEQETGAKCMFEEDLQHVSSYNGVPKLVLWECPERDPERVLVALRSSGIQKLCRDCIVLFNISHGLGIEEKCVWRGVRGFFYQDDSLPQFLKGVRAILNGQLWLSRELVTRCILDNRGRDNSSEMDSPILTQRESEVLAQLAVGVTNGEISDQLCISPHTVKTHLYNIYKKLNVPNRLQASLWAAKHL